MQSLETSFDAIVVHSGGMDSSLCLAVAVREFGPQNVLSMSFDYGQRHSKELERATRIAEWFDVKNIVVPIVALSRVTDNALMNGSLSIQHSNDQPPTTLVEGRNGLMVRLAAIHAKSLGAHCVYTGVIEVESANSGYRDCSRAYMDLMQEILRLDLDDPTFEVRTPVVKMSKTQTLELGHQLGVLEFLLRETITCYNGVPEVGCQTCPACELRNEGLRKFLAKYPQFDCPYTVPTI